MLGTRRRRLPAIDGRNTTEVFYLALETVEDESAIGVAADETKTITPCASKSKKRRIMKAPKNELTQQQRAQIRRLINPVLCDMMRKGKSGKFKPSDDLCTGLEKVGGTRRDWKVEFEAIKKGHVKAAFDKIGIFFDKVDGKQVPLGVIKCVADNTSTWGMGRPENFAP